MAKMKIVKLSVSLTGVKGVVLIDSNKQAWYAKRSDKFAGKEGDTIETADNKLFKLETRFASNELEAIK